MPQYANSKMRERFVNAAPQLPQLAQKLRINVVAGPLILATEHEGVLVVEADAIETVQEFLVQSGLVQWQSARVSPAISLQEAIQMLDRLPAPIH